MGAGATGAGRPSPSISASDARRGRPPPRPPPSRRDDETVSVTDRDRDLRDPAALAAEVEEAKTEFDGIAAKWADTKGELQDAAEALDAAGGTH